MLPRTVVPHRNACPLRSYAGSALLEPICHMMSYKLVFSPECKFNVTFNALPFLISSPECRISDLKLCWGSGNRVPSRPTHDAFLPPITEFNEVWIALGGNAGIGTLQGGLRLHPGVSMYGRKKSSQMKTLFKHIAFGGQILLDHPVQRASTLSALFLYGELERVISAH